MGNYLIIRYKSRGLERIFVKLGKLIILGNLNTREKVYRHIHFSNTIV